MKTRLVIVLLGPPASGKGTQAQKIAQALGGRAISTGYYLRKAVLSGTPLGRQARAYVEKGELVPDSVVVDLVRQTLLPSGDDAAAVLDGFPRTLAQAEALDMFLPPWRVLFIDLHPSKVLERIVGRCLGPNGEPYHTVYNPPPSGIPVIQRCDDREDVVQERLEVYYQQTEPLLKYYDGRQVLARIAGNGSIEQVFGRILPFLPVTSTK